MSAPCLLAALLLAIAGAGCDDPEIRCIDDEQCLTGQSCHDGRCRYLVPRDAATVDAAVRDAQPDAGSGTSDAATSDAGAVDASSICAAECRPGQYCSAEARACRPCNVEDHCGDDCEPCGDDLPYCGGDACVECTEDAHCGIPSCCRDNQCVLVGC